MRPVYYSFALFIFHLYGAGRAAIGTGTTADAGFGKVFIEGRNELTFHTAFG